MIGTFAALESSSMVEWSPEEAIFGRSSTMNTILRRVAKSADPNMPMLLQGDSNTRKEILARLIHRLSQCGNGAFAKVSCAAIPGMLLETELFGYGKQGFTGAQGTKPTWRVPFCGHLDESRGNFVWLDRVF